MWTWVQNSDTPLLHSYIETWVPQCGGVCVYQSHHFWSTPWLECVHVISTCIYVHLTPNVCFKSLMNSYMETWVPCMAQCLFSSHLTSGPIPCLECVHASVYVYMSTWLPMCSSNLLCIVTCKPGLLLYGTVYVCPSQPISVPTPSFRMCTCISTCTTCPHDLQMSVVHSLLNS